MRPLYIPLILLALLASCNGSATDNVKANYADDTEVYNNSTDQPKIGTSGNTPKQTSKKAPTSNNWEKLVMMPVKDARGRLIAQIPFPSGWKMMPAKQGEPSILGPNGVQIMNTPLNSYTYTNDPYMQQMYYQSGTQLRYWPGAEALVQQDLVPELQKEGWLLMNSYLIPEVAKVDKWYNDQLYKVAPMQMEILAIGTEWKDSKGQLAYIVTHVQVSTDANMQYWSHYSSILVAEPDHFKKAVKQYTFALANTRYTLEPIMEYNRSEAEKAGRSWAAFNKRMAQNQANFEQQQRNYVNNSNAVSDAIMDGWRKRNASSDRQQEQYIDGIYEETNTVNTTTGEQYKVDAGYNQYWMNNNGQYISTELDDYNPNYDDNMNDQNWQQLQEVD